MNWNISAWSIRTPVPSLVLFMVLITLGYVSFGQLAVMRFPNIDMPDEVRRARCLTKLEKI